MTNFVFSAAIQAGIEAGKYIQVFNSAGVPISMVRDAATGQFAAHAVGEAVNNSQFVAHAVGAIVNNSQFLVDAMGVALNSGPLSPLVLPMQLILRTRALKPSKLIWRCRGSKFTWAFKPSKPVWGCCKRQQPSLVSELSPG